MDTPSPALDSVQAQYLNEECILVDEADQMLTYCLMGFLAHLLTTKASLHRAFSVFLFDNECRLLLQCRAPEKITFPSLWTNTCCSHPLYPDECGSDGVLKAAKRKLFHELGIHTEQWNDSDFVQLDLMRYCAPCDDVWGENEVDHILFCKKNVDLEINTNEVCDVKYVTKDELVAAVKSERSKFTPWFLLIFDHFLLGWWEQLQQKGIESFSGYKQKLIALK